MDWNQWVSIAVVGVVAMILLIDLIRRPPADGVADDADDAVGFTDEHVETGIS